MGNATSNVSSGVKDQASGGTKGLYKYINLVGGGELVDLMKTATRTKDFGEVDERIVNGLKDFMYNPDGSSQVTHVSRIVAAKRGMNLKDLPDRPQDVDIIASHAGDPDWWKAPGRFYIHV